MITFMAEEEVDEWLRERELLGPDNPPHPREIDDDKLHQVHWFAFDLQRHEELGDTLADLFESDEEILVCVREIITATHWSPAKVNILHRFREALGDPGTVWDKPGHLFGGAHLDMHSLLLLVLDLWGSMDVVSGSGKVVARVFDAGSIFSLYAADPELLSAEPLERLGKLERGEPLWGTWPGDTQPPGQ